MSKMRKAVVVAMALGVAVVFAVVITASLVLRTKTVYTVKLVTDPHVDQHLAPVGEPLEITCRGDPKHDNNFKDFSWINPNGKNVSEGDPSVQEVGGTALRLLFRSPQEQDGGTYKCVAKHGNDNLKTEISVYFYDNSRIIQPHTFRAPLLDVNSGKKLPEISNDVPSFDTTYEKLVLEESSEAEITCSARGEKPIIYTWHNQHDQAIESNVNSSKYVAWSENGSTLFIRYVRPEDEGSYVCRASNQHGLSSKIYEITVNPSTISPNDTKDDWTIRTTNITANSVEFDISASHFTGVSSIEVEYKESRNKTEHRLEWKKGDVYIVKDLISAGLYTFTFRALSSNNSIVWSEMYNVTLLPAVPEVIFRYLGSDSVKIEWMRGFDEIMRETIDKYQLQYYRVQRQNGRTWKPNDCVVTIELTSCFGGSVYTIAGLYKTSYYEIVVRAHTASGYGDPYKQKIYMS